MIEPLQDVTAQQCFNFTFQLAADVVAWKGLGTAYTFLKEIDVLEKRGGSAAVVARTLRYIEEIYNELVYPSHQERIEIAQKYLTQRI